MKSKDYNALYGMICAGEIVPAFVDYTFFGNGDPRTYRDVCAVKRKKEFDIDINARGVSYGSIYDFNRTHAESEKDLFINECERLNLEYYC